MIAVEIETTHSYEESLFVMNRHIGQSKLNSAIAALGVDPTTCSFIREAIRRWGVQILTPILPTLLTNREKDAQYSAHLHSSNAYVHNEVAILLSPDFLPRPMALRAGLPLDVSPQARQAAAAFIAHRRADATMRRYQSCFRTIVNMAVRLNVQPYPMSPGGAISIISQLATEGMAYGSLCAIRDTITMMHNFEGLPNPVKNRTFKHVFDGVRRVIGVGTPNRKLALTREELGKMIQIELDRWWLDLAAMYAVGFEGALRASDLLNLEYRDVIQRDGRVWLQIGKSKGDQGGYGALVEIKHKPGAPFNAIALLNMWIAHRGTAPGFLFADAAWRTKSRQRRTLSRQLKRSAVMIGLDPTEVASHSLRAGYCTAEIDAGAHVADVAAHLRHKSIDMLLVYYRPRGARPNFVAKAAA